MGSGVPGTWVPAGISENLGTVRYGVTARKKFLGTDGYRVPTKFQFIPTPDHVEIGSVEPGDFKFHIAQNDPTSDIS